MQTCQWLYSTLLRDTRYQLSLNLQEVVRRVGEHMHWPLLPNILRRV
jgi:hypothetical protein